MLLVKDSVFKQLIHFKLICRFSAILSKSQWVVVVVETFYRLFYNSCTEVKGNLHSLVTRMSSRSTKTGWFIVRTGREKAAFESQVRKS